MHDTLSQEAVKHTVVMTGKPAAESCETSPRQSVHIAICCDEGGADFTQVCIKSIFANNRDVDVTIHLLTDINSQAILNEIDSIASCFGQTIKIYPINPEEVLKLPESHTASINLPKAACFRFLIPDKIDYSIDKILYLDSDIIVNGPLLPLWLTELNDNVLAAVRENRDIARNNRLGFNKEDYYFNFGVILMNLALWRKLNISDRCLQWLDSHSDIAEYPDQDAINVISHGRVKFLHPRYNLVTSFIYKENYGSYSAPEVCDEAIANPVIIHYTSFKPWIKYFPPMLCHSPRPFRKYMRMHPATTMRKRAPRRICVTAADYRYWLKNHHRVGPFFRFLARMKQKASSLFHRS